MCKKLVDKNKMYFIKVHQKLFAIFWSIKFDQDTLTDFQTVWNIILYIEI